jgi:hypothetical protein
MSILDRMYRVIFANGDMWDIPVEIIARNRAEYYASTDPDFKDDINKSLEEDTIPLFESDYYEIKDWAQNNMNWKDVKHRALFVGRVDSMFAYEEMWTNPEEVEIV